MNISKPTRCALLIGVLAVAPSRAHAQIERHLGAQERDCPPAVWFQVTNGGSAGATGHSGIVHLGAEQPDPQTPSHYEGGFLSWNPQGVYFTRFGGTVATSEVFGPSGAALADVRGIARLAAAFEHDVDVNTGALVAVVLHAGALVWDAVHVYLVLVGGGVTTVEVQLASGASMPGIKGISLLAADLVDTDPSVNNVAVALTGGALEYDAGHLYLTTFGGAVATAEVADPSGTAISSVRGVETMGGAAGGALEAAAFVWTPTHVWMFLSGLAVGVTEIHDSSGASIAGTWGIVRQSTAYNGMPPFSGLASIYNASREFLVLVGGSIVTVEIPRPAGGSIASNVGIPGNNALLHQATGLMEIFASWSPPGLPLMRGTVIGLRQ